MTPEQKDRIKRAALELGQALSAPNREFDINVRHIPICTIEREKPSHKYTVHVNVKTEEVIA